MLVLVIGRLNGQDTAAVRFANDSLRIRFVEADLRAVIQALGRCLPKPVLVGAIQPVRVSLETPAPVPRGAIPGLLAGLVQSQGLEFVEDSTFFRVGQRSPEAVRHRPGQRAMGGAGTRPRCSCL
jgi:type II secretory pathway component GspD/PulD (secretin)